MSQEMMPNPPQGGAETMQNQSSGSTYGSNNEGSEDQLAPATETAQRLFDPNEGDPQPDQQQPYGMLNTPSKGANAAEWDAFYTQMGRPAKATGYRLPIPKGETGEFAQTVAPLLHQAGLSQTQAQQLAQGWNQLSATAQAQLEHQQQIQAEHKAQQDDQQVNDLKGAWGKQFDQNLELARRAKNQFLPAEQADDIVDALEEKLGVKATIELLHNIGKGLAEDSAAGLETNGTRQHQSAARVLFGK